MVRITSEQLKKELESGLNPREIAKKNGMHPQSLYQRVKRLKMDWKREEEVPKEKIEKMYESGMTMKEIADEMEKSVTFVENRLRNVEKRGFGPRKGRGGRPRERDFDEEEAVKLYEKYKSSVVVAKMLDASKSTVLSVIKKKGVDVVKGV